MTDPVTQPATGRRWSRVLLWSILGLVLVVAITGFMAQQHLMGRLHRIDAASAGLSGRPGASAGGAVDFLVLTTDRTASPALQGGVPAPAWLPQARHVDSAFVLHLTGDRLSAAVVSLPTTSWHGSLTRPADVVRSVETATGVRMDHLAAFDWSGFRRLADTSDGVQLTGPKGRYAVDGAQALTYVGEPEAGSTRQDLRELAFLRELMFDTLHTSMRHDPLLLWRKLDTVTGHLSVEAGWTRWQMADLVLSLRNLRSAAISYLPSRADDSDLWRAVRSDRLQSWLTAHPDRLVPADMTE